MDEAFRRASALMPWGTQTSSKRVDPALAEVMPAFINQAEGCRIQASDGRWFTDYRSSLGPVILGHRHPAVEAAVLEQLQKGVLFSMASPLELEVAERMLALLPWAEQVRFVKSGHTANAAAVRLARAFTGRDHLITCGYHGHSDWFAAGAGEVPLWTHRAGNGVPTMLDGLVSRVAYGDTTALERLFEARGRQTAAVILTPCPALDEPSPSFVQAARSLASSVGALLSFDEGLSGFRVDMAGGAGLLKVTPDLATYAKALANGYPLAALAGRRDVMTCLERVIITETYAGETLSLAADAATLETFVREPVIDHIQRTGLRLKDGFNAIAQRIGLGAEARGLPAMPWFQFHQDPTADAAARLAFHRGLFERGIFPHHPFLLSFAHTEAVVDETLEAFEGILGEMVHQGF